MGPLYLKIYFLLNKVFQKLLMRFPVSFAFRSVATAQKVAI